MFEHYAKHDKILVTGPHRGMTTFAATAIQHDLEEHGLIREELCWLPNDNLERLNYWLNECPAKIVAQAPFAADMCHKYKHCLVVFLHRPIEEIEASQKRMFHANGEDVFWPEMEMTERRKYHQSDYSIPVGSVKYKNWQLQKERLAHYVELSTETLKEHPLYVPKPDRTGFHVRQTHVA